MKWVNIAGLLLQFLAFWLAAPELLGEDTLKRFEKGLTKFIARMPVILFILVVTFYFSYFGIGGLLKGLKAADEGIEESEMVSFFISMGIGTLIYMIYIFSYKRINKWLELKVAEPLTDKLINNNQTRKNSLIAGAIFFTLGFLLQLTAAVWA